MIRRWIILVVAAAAVVAGLMRVARLSPRSAGATQSVAVTTRPTTASSLARLQAAVEYLASRELGGRGLGSPGLEKAALFIEEQFAEVGLVNVPGLEGYRHPVAITTTAGIGVKTSLSAEPGDLRFQSSSDYAPMSLSAEKAFEGTLVFAGYGISAPARNYDDYAGLDVKGKVVLSMRVEPLDEKGKTRLGGPGRFSSHAELGTKVRLAAARGAAALLLVTPTGRKATDELMPLATIFRGTPAKIPVLHVTRAAADRLLAAGGSRKLKDLQSAIDSAFKPQSQDLPKVRVSGEVSLNHGTINSRNVVGLLKGKGASADEYIILGAHYDHLGGAGERINYGADDNASGTAAVMELARVLAAGGPLKRSVIFVAFTGEESGMFGSEHFLEHPPVPVAMMAAMLNFDMVGRVRGKGLVVYGTRESKSLCALVERAAEGTGLLVAPGNRHGLMESDSAAFYEANVPTMFLFSGVHNDYHSPRDTPDKINLGGIGQVVDFASRLVRSIADAPRAELTRPAVSDAEHERVEDPSP